MSSGISGVIVLPVALAAAAVLSPAMLVYGAVRAGQAIHDEMLDAQVHRARAERDRHARLNAQVESLAVACEELGLDSIAGEDAPDGQLTSISAANDWANALAAVNDPFEARVRAKQQEVDSESRALAAEQARIAAQISDHTALVRVGTELGLSVPEFVSMANAGIRRASERAREQADSLVQQNQTFQASIGVAHRAAKGDDGGLRSSGAVIRRRSRRSRNHVRGRGLAGLRKSQRKSR